MKRFFIQSSLFFLLTVIASGAVGQTYNYYFGNIHAHSSYSDGAKDGAKTRILTPAECYTYAKSAQHFDFLGISEHNHLQAKMHLSNYAKGLLEAKKANEDGKFVCLYGMEYGVIKNGGHVIIYGLDQLVGWEPGNYTIFSAKSDYSHLFQLVADHPGAFATLAHPATVDYNGLISKRYDPTIDQAVTGVAISSGPAFSTAEDYSNRAAIKYYGYYKRLLALGYNVGPTMDHDNHYTTFGHMSPTRTVLLSQVLSRDSLLAAYHAGRFYASEDWDTKVDFRINGQPLGSHLTGTSSLLITATVSDPDPGDNIESIQLWYGKPGSGETAKILKTVAGQSILQLPLKLKDGENFYYFLEVTQTDGDRMVTSPIWATSKQDQNIPTGSNSEKSSGFGPNIPQVLNPLQPGSPPQTLITQIKKKKTSKSNITMNPQIIFWLAFAILGISVAYCSRVYCMLKDNSTALKQPYSWSRVQLAWWTVIILSSFIAILFTYNEAPTLTTSTVILLGISAATTAIARTIDVSDAASSTSVSTQSNSSGFLLDILSDQNGVNIHRFQTVVFNFVFGCWFIVSVLEHLHNIPDDGIDAIMPDIATTNLVLLGLSSATYAALKTTEKKPTEKLPGYRPEPPASAPDPVPAPVTEPATPNNAE